MSGKSSLWDAQLRAYASGAMPGTLWVLCLTEDRAKAARAIVREYVEGERYVIVDTAPPSQRLAVVLDEDQPIRRLMDDEVRRLHHELLWGTPPPESPLKGLLEHMTKAVAKKLVENAAATLQRKQNWTSLNRDWRKKR